MPDPVREIACQELVELVTDYLEDALAPTETELFEQHLGSCEGCARYVEQMRGTIAAGERLREDEVPDEVLDSLLVAFADRKRS